MTTEATPPSEPQPSQPRLIDTRERLLVYGRRAFSRLGLDGTSLTHDILEPAGVGMETFHVHFEDKTDLLIEILRHAAAMRRESVMERGFRSAEGLTFEQSLKFAFEQIFASIDLEEHAWRVHLNVQWILEPRIRQLVVELQGLFVDELTAFFAVVSEADLETRRRAAVLLFAVGTGFATMYLNLGEGEHALQRDDLIKGALELTTPGLTALLT
jgi:AcrR family transcriptional regulator